MHDAIVKNLCQLTGTFLLLRRGYRSLKHSSSAGSFRIRAVPLLQGVLLWCYLRCKKKKLSLTCNLQCDIFSSYRKKKLNLMSRERTNSLEPAQELSSCMHAAHKSSHIASCSNREMLVSRNDSKLDAPWDTLTLWHCHVDPSVVAVNQSLKGKVRGRLWTGWTNVIAFLLFTCFTLLFICFSFQCWWGGTHVAPVSLGCV